MTKQTKVKATSHGSVPKQIINKTKAMRSDNGGEFSAVSAFLKEQEIEHQITAPFSPQQNGVAERFNRALVEGARSMLVERKVQKHLWVEATM